MKKNLLIIGAGGVAHVAAHKAAMHNDVLGDICIASRTVSKCEAIIDSVKRKGHIKDESQKVHARQLDALDVAATAALIRETGSEIVMNLGSAFVNMAVLDACIETGAAYIDTAIHEDPDKVCEDPPWYANYEWQKKDLCTEKGVTAVLGAGFDPGVVNAYAALAVKKYFDTIDTIDILDVNAGSHGRYFATNFDPEINFREFVKVWTWIDREWQEFPTHAVKRTFTFPVVGEQPIYLNGHDELHSLSKNIDARSIRFWMGFGDHYINVFTVLRTLGLLSHEPVQLAGGGEAIPLRVVKAVLPDPQSLAANYTGKTCIGDIIKGTKDGAPPRAVHLSGVRSRRGLCRGGIAGDQLHRGRSAGRRRHADRRRPLGCEDDGERRGARPRAVHRHPRRDRPADRVSGDRTRLAGVVPR